MLKFAIIGSLAGIANGFFGAGGGMFLVPLFINWVKMNDKTAFATSVSIILPLSVVSSVVYYFQGSVDLSLATPYLIGGFFGGILSGIIFKNLSVTPLKRILGIMIIYGGVRSLLCL